MLPTQSVRVSTIAMIEHFLSSGIEVVGVSAEGFYSKSGFLKPLKELGLSLVSKPRCDSWWILNGEKIQIKQYAKTIPIESFHYSFSRRRGYESYECRQHRYQQQHVEP